jgi:hypothetical protein
VADNINTNPAVTNLFWAYSQGGVVTIYNYTNGASADYNGDNLVVGATGSVVIDNVTPMWGGVNPFTPSTNTLTYPVYTFPAGLPGSATFIYNFQPGNPGGNNGWHLYAETFDYAGDPLVPTNVVATNLYLTGWAVFAAGDGIDTNGKWTASSIWDKGAANFAGGLVGVATNGQLTAVSEWVNGTANFANGAGAQINADSSCSFGGWGVYIGNTGYSTFPGINIRPNGYLTLGANAGINGTAFVINDNGSALFYGVAFTNYTTVPPWWGSSNQPMLWASNNAAGTAVPVMYRTYYDASQVAHTTPTSF